MESYFSDKVCFQQRFLIKSLKRDFRVGRRGHRPSTEMAAGGLLGLGVGPGGDPAGGPLGTVSGWDILMPGRRHIHHWGPLVASAFKCLNNSFIAEVPNLFGIKGPAFP